jgi:hypothetical protein
MDMGNMSDAEDAAEGPEDTGYQELTGRPAPKKSKPKQKGK